MKKLDLEVLTVLLHQIRGHLTSARAKRAADLLLREIGQLSSQTGPGGGTATLQETLELLLDVAEDAEGLTACNCDGDACAGTCTHALAIKAQVKAKDILVAFYGQCGQAENGSP